MKILNKEYKEVKLLSVDIFDTLIFRILESPSAIFIEMGNFIKKRYKDKFKFTPYEFRQIRIAAEQKARQIKNETLGIKEVSLNEIYSYFPPMCCSIDELKTLEIELEKKYCYINPQINNLINECDSKGIKVVLTSDMYLSSNEIKEILQFNEFNIDLIDDFFISSEKKLSKSDDGKLFEDLMKQYCFIKSNEILHVGDNIISDVINSERHGMLSYHYNILSMDYDNLFEKEKIKYGDIVPEIYAVRKLSVSNNFKYNTKQKVWFNFGATVLGPFLSLFCEWIIDTAEKENIKEIYPLMREGYILEKMLNNLINYRNLKIHVKPLYVSRNALFLPSLNIFTRCDLVKMFERSNFTVKNLFDNLKISNYIGNFKKFSQLQLKDTYKINILEETLSEKIINYILSEKIIKIINNNIQEQKKLFLQYLKKNFNVNNGFITVDLGFRGTMQSSINKILNQYKLEKIVHLIAFGEECIKNNLLLGEDIRGFIGNAGENDDIVKSITWCPDIIEELMMGDIGSTIGYKKKESNIEPVLDKNRIPKDELRLKEICIDGVLTFQNMFLKFIDNKPFVKDTILKSRRDIGKILERFYKIPTYNEAITFSKIHHENNFGSTDAAKLVDEDIIRILDRMSVEKFLKLSNPKDVKWPESLVTIKYPSYFLKKEIENTTKQGYFRTMCTIAEEVRINDIYNIMVYGAGEAGIYLTKALEIYGVKVIYLIDRNVNLHGKFINNVQIISLDEAIQKGNNVYAIGSFAFKYEIEKNILDKYIGADIKPKIFKLKELF